jgi:hypothetical protein
MRYHTTPVPAVNELSDILQTLHMNDQNLEGQQLETIHDYERDGICKETEFPTDEGVERTGVTHLAHAWYAQGHKVCANF